MVVPTPTRQHFTWQLWACRTQLPSLQPRSTCTRRFAPSRLVAGHIAVSGRQLWWSEGPGGYFGTQTRLDAESGQLLDSCATRASPRRSLSALVSRSHGRQGREREASRLAFQMDTRTRHALPVGQAMFSCWDADASHKSGRAGDGCSRFGARAHAHNSLPSCIVGRAGGRARICARVRRRRWAQAHCQLRLSSKRGVNYTGSAPQRNPECRPRRGATRRTMLQRGAPCCSAVHAA
jgi:hypothetical protein